MPGSPTIRTDVRVAAIVAARSMIWAPARVSADQADLLEQEGRRAGAWLGKVVVLPGRHAADRGIETVARRARD